MRQRLHNKQEILQVKNNPAPTKNNQPYAFMSRPETLSKQLLKLPKSIFSPVPLLMMIGTELNGLAAHFLSFVLSDVSENRTADGGKMAIMCTDASC